MLGIIVGFTARYAVKAVGFSQGPEVPLFLVLATPAIFGSYLYGHLVDRPGAEKCLMKTILIWSALLVAMVALPEKNAFRLVGPALGVNQGGISTAEHRVLFRQMRIVSDRSRQRA